MAWRAAPYALDVGSNVITVRVTAEDGTTKDYTVTVTREAELPGEPTGLLISAGDARLDLSWTAPGDDGGSALTGYDVHYTSAAAGAVGDSETVQTGGSLSSADGWVAVGRGAEADPPAASQAITGLANDTAYRVRVRARNAAGASGWLTGTGTPQQTDTTGPSAPTFVPGRRDHDSGRGDEHHADLHRGGQEGRRQRRLHGPLGPVRHPDAGTEQTPAARPLPTPRASTRERPSSPSTRPATSPTGRCTWGFPAPTTTPTATPARRPAPPSRWVPRRRSPRTRTWAHSRRARPRAPWAGSRR